MPWNPPPTRTTDYAVTADDDWNPVVESLAWLEEIAYVEFTSDVALTATTVGTANQIVSAPTLDYENVRHVIELSCVRKVAPAATHNLILRDGTTVLGTIARWTSGEHTSPVSVFRVFTPSAGLHTFNFAAWTNSGSGSFEAGSGGTAGDSTSDLPGWLRISRVPTA